MEINEVRNQKSEVRSCFCSGFEQHSKEYFTLKEEFFNNLEFRSGFSRDNFEQQPKNISP
ncbi:hypothetical protein ACP6PL_22550 [Dapis sp. BLCC M126]|uniref:hypothetical protein n=1 Tax=Dapis sp. BLCC M126 TaxID=3400189 RepID=UPI003CF129CA